MVTTAASAQTTIASWQFSTLYEESTNSEKTYYYTPNTAGEYAGMGYFWYSDKIPVFYPQTYINGTQTDYYMTAAGRYWQIGQNGKTFLTENTTTNEITDFTDASSHKTYVELNFPTTGYKDIQLKFGYYSHTAVTGITVVVSPDGGTTWLKGEDIAAPSSLTDETVSLGVANKSNVKVRLLCENGKAGYSYYSYLTITGTEIGSTSLYTGSVAVDDDSHGSALIIPAGGTYEDGSSVTVTATNKIGWAFAEWQDGSGNQLSTENPYTFNINANTTAVAVFKLSPVAAGTDVTVASWTFDSGYDAAGLVYTPNNSAWVAIAQTQSKNNQNPQIVANAGYKAINGYVATISNDDTGKTYYSVKDNNGDKVLSLYPNGISNSVSDYTNAAEHTVYAQFTFSTIGLKDIKIAPAFTYGSSNAVRNMEVVYSTDGGTTWIDGGTCAGGSNWFTYGTDVKDISADNAAQVIVRLLPANDENGDYRINSFTVTGTVAPRSLTIGDTGYATYYNDCAVEIPAGLTAYWGKLSSDGTKVEMTEITDGIIPAETAVVVKGTANTYTLTATADAGSTYAANALRGVVANTTVASLGLGSGTLYVLAKAASTNKAAFCPYTGASLGDHRAYLFVLSAAPAPMLSLDFGEGTTGIADVKASVVNAENTYYNLNGQRVDNGYKGIVIGNGKKVIKK